MNQRSVRVAVVFAVGGAGVMLGSFAGCSTSSTAVGEADGGGDVVTTPVPDAAPDTGVDDADVDAGADSAPPPLDSATPDAAPDAQDAGPVVVTGMAIVSKTGATLGAVPGDALPLKVVFTMSDGTTTDLPPGTSVTWISPATVTAQDPYDAGASGIPDGGALPTAFYIANPYRPERSDYPGVLFVINAGTVGDAGVGVTAQLADGGTISAVVPIGPAPVGDADAGAMLFGSAGVSCFLCHGAQGEGSPPVMVDGGIFLVDGGPVYSLFGGTYTYPAPGLNATTPEGGSPNVAADPAWSAALLGMAAQGDMDNKGVGLRAPMPDWLGKLNPAGQPLSGKDFADIYAWLKTQPTP